jgi:hypothetical protein
MNGDLVRFTRKNSKNFQGEEIHSSLWWLSCTIRNSQFTLIRNSQFTLVIELHDQKLVKSITWQVERATIKTIDPQNGLRPKNYRIWMGQMVKKGRILGYLIFRQTHPMHPPS